MIRVVFLILAVGFVVTVSLAATVKIRSNADVPLPLIRFAEQLEKYPLGWHTERGQMIAQGLDNKIVLKATPEGAPFDIEVTLTPISKGER